MIGGDFVALLDSRANVERTIERLIGVLDDFDADLEDLEAEFDDDIDEDKEQDDNGVADPDGYAEQFGCAVAGALNHSIGGYVA